MLLLNKLKTKSYNNNIFSVSNPTNIFPVDFEKKTRIINTHIHSLTVYIMSPEKILRKI